MGKKGTDLQRDGRTRGLARGSSRTGSSKSASSSAARGDGAVAAQRKRQEAIPPLGIEVPFLWLDREERGRPRSCRIRRVARDSGAVLWPARTHPDDCPSVAGPRQRLKLSPPQPRRTAPYPGGNA